MSSPDTTSTPPPASGPNPPHGQASETELHAEVTVTSGPNPPHGGAAVAPHTLTSGAGPAAAPAVAPDAQAANRSETVAIRLSVPKPHPFSVFISSTRGKQIQIESIEIHIYDNDKPVFNTLVAAGSPVVLTEASESHVFPLSDQQLAQLLPHLQAGNVVEIRVQYLAPENSELKIGIIGKDFHSKLGHYIEHLFQSE